MSNSLTNPTLISLLNLASGLEHAARLAPAIVPVVAKSGAGRTTFVDKLILELKARGLRVGVLKHNGHTTSFHTPWMLPMSCLHLNDATHG